MEMLIAHGPYRNLSVCEACGNMQFQELPVLSKQSDKAGTQYAADYSAPLGNNSQQLQFICKLYDCVWDNLLLLQWQQSLLRVIATIDFSQNAP